MKPAELFELTLLAALWRGSFLFILYFRLIRSAGATRAMSVTFLIPVFGMLWGALVLDETVTLNMLAGTAIILAGTALTTGFIVLRGTKPPL